MSYTTEYPPENRIGISKTSPNTGYQGRHTIGHVAVFRTYANSLILRLARTFQGPCQFVVWFLSYLGWIYSETL